MYGKVRNIDYDMKHYGKSYFNLTQPIATAKDGDKEYEILQNIGGGVIVRTNKNKNEFILDLQNIMNLAIEAGLDKDPEEIYTQERIESDKKELKTKEKKK